MSWLKKMSSRAKAKKDPAVKIRKLKEECYARTQRAIARVDSSSNELMQCVGGIAMVFGIWILAGFFNIPYKDVEKINERITIKTEAIRDKWITADDLINYEIRPSHWRNNSIAAILKAVGYTSLVDCPRFNEDSNLSILIAAGLKVRARRLGR